MKSVLVLGAGLVSRPIVRHLLDVPELRVLVADQHASKAEALVAGHERGRGLGLDVSDVPTLESLVREADLVVSLLPYSFHVAVAKLVIAHRKHLVTTSYVSPSMRALDAEARAAGVLLLNEMGLDPGIDHMSAMRLIRSLQDRGAAVVGFSSCCGGLPAPEANTNPWGYKFSWSPRGVLLAGRNDARYLAAGKIVEVPGPQLFTHVAPYEIDGLGALESYPNRDSLAYIPVYGLEGIEDMFRGTIRYPGWCETLHAIASLGLLGTEERGWRAGTTAAEFVEAILHAAEGPARKRVAERLGLPLEHPVLGRLEWAGLFSHEPIGTERAAPLDILEKLLEERMRYAPGERDMIVLRHVVTARHPDGRFERRLSTLVAFGERRGDSAMARTVSLPAAIAARRIVEGKLDLAGVAIPTIPEIYEPVLDALESLGIRCEERTL